MKHPAVWPALLLFAVPPLAHAQPWEFDKPVAVTMTQGEGIFHHLESSGRKNIAVSAGTVAVAWEDNRDGTPRIYLARKQHGAGKFTAEVRVSGEGEAYDPSLIALDDNRFAVAWEEDARIHLRLITPGGPGPVAIVTRKGAMQASLARHDQELLLVYSWRDGRHGRIRIQRLAVAGQTARPEQDCVVDAAPVQDEQLYPVVVRLAERALVAWEDRRPGHTVIMAARNGKQDFCHFSPPQRISEGPTERRAGYGKGHGVARVAMARYGNGQVLAVWADKRDFREGYDIYSARYQPGENRLFGPNRKVQDSFGGVAQQWHATVAGNPSGRLVVGWDDNRDGDANIMLSWPEDDGWSDDLVVPGADGAGEQNHPTVTLDREGNLHLAWVERTTIGGPTRLRYLFGKALDQVAGVTKRMFPRTRTFCPRRECLTCSGHELYISKSAITGAWSEGRSQLRGVLSM